MAISQLTRWDDVGSTPGAGAAKYVAGDQPISEYDNWFNWSAAKDVENLIAALENITTGHDHDGVNSKQVDGSDVVNTPAGNIAATDVQAAIDELDTEKETPTGAQTKVNTHAADTSTHGVAEVADKATVTAEIDSDVSTHGAVSTNIHGVGAGNSVASDDDIATHEADTSVHGVAEVADVATISAIIDNRIAIHAAVTTNIHGTGAGNVIVGDDELVGKLNRSPDYDSGCFSLNASAYVVKTHNLNTRNLIVQVHYGSSDSDCINDGTSGTGQPLIDHGNDLAVHLLRCSSINAVELYNDVGVARHWRILLWKGA